MPSELIRCFCGVTHCPHARAIAAQEVRQWARSKTPEERAAMAEECTRGVQRLLRTILPQSDAPWYTDPELSQGDI